MKKVGLGRGLDALMGSFEELEEKLPENVPGMPTEIDINLIDVNKDQARKSFDEAKLKEELVDVTHFLLSMCIHSGMDAQELFDIYLEKNRENVNRQHGTSDKKGYEVDKLGH